MGYSPWGHKELDTTERLHLSECRTWLCCWDKKDGKVGLKPQERQVERKHRMRKDGSVKGRQSEMYRFNDYSGDTKKGKPFLNP